MKKKKKRVKIKIIPFLIVALIIALLVGLFYLLSLIPIKNIYIKGNKYLSDQEIIELANIEDYPSFIKTTINSMKRGLNKNLYIKEINISKKLFGTVYIEVYEKKILFRKDDTKKVVLEDKMEIDDNNVYQLPVLLNYVPDTKYDSFIKGMGLVSENVKTQISEIRYFPNEQDENRFLLYMNDGNYVYLTLTKFKQINYYEEVLEKLEGKKGILYLDSGNHFQIMEE